MLHEALRLIRVYHDLPRSKLSAELGISESVLYQYETGKKYPSSSLLQRYSSRFGIPISSLHFFSTDYSSDITSGVRIFVAQKLIMLLQWIEAKSVKKNASI